MALFALWRQPDGKVETIHRRLVEDCHVVHERTTTTVLGRGATTWHLAAFATATRFYAPEDQVWISPAGDEACIIHGLVWREVGGSPQLLTAGDVSRLIDRPGCRLDPDICGEYAVVRFFANGVINAFGDPAGLHHLFYADTGQAIVANRAGFVAAICGYCEPDSDTLSWLPTIGYRVGTGTAYHGVRALPQDHLLELCRGGLTLVPPPSTPFAESGRGDPDVRAGLQEDGIVQALAAVRIATDHGDRIDLPITGGKDSRVVLALCLAAGLRDRLSLFTRGYAGHPDVIAGAGVAAAAGLPHRREPPHGSDLAANWPLDMFVRNLAVQAFQADGMMGGWDLIIGERLGRETLITGHMGEVLKAYSKRPMPEGRLDPVDMIRLQAPFDPLGLLRPEHRDRLTGQVSAQMDAGRAAGASERDLPDLFYWQNRIPNWLGGIRGIKSFERQPVMPLGVPALMRLAFLLSPEERKVELLHYRLIERLAPELLTPAFALQTWDAGLAAHGATPPMADPVRAGAAAPPVFGNWQYSLNSNPAIRAWLIDLIATKDIALWEVIDRAVLIDRLRTRRFDYFGGISLLGLVAAVFASIGFALPVKLSGERRPPLPTDPARPIAPEMRALAQGEAPPCAPRLHGHLDDVRGARRFGDAHWLAEADMLTLIGWLFAPELEGVQCAIEVLSGGEVVALGTGDRPRRDLAALCRGDGRYGFAIDLRVSRLRELADGGSSVPLQVRAFDSGFVAIGGDIVVDL